VRLCVPQLPQAWLCCWPDSHCGLVSQPAGWQPASTTQTWLSGQLPFKQLPPQPSDWPQPASAQEATQQLPFLQVCAPVQQLPPPPLPTQKLAAGQQAPRHTSPLAQTVLPQACPHTPPTQLSPTGQTTPTQAVATHAPW